MTFFYFFFLKSPPNSGKGNRHSATSARSRRKRHKSAHNENVFLLTGSRKKKLKTAENVIRVMQLTNQECNHSLAGYRSHGITVKQNKNHIITYLCCYILFSAGFHVNEQINNSYCLHNLFSNFWIFKSRKQ